MLVYMLIPPIGFITANYVARPLGYHMKRGFGEGYGATMDLFRNVDRFAERFDDLIGGIKEMGFEAIDLWCGHLEPSWTTARHLEIARSVVDHYGLPVTTYAFHGGGDETHFRTIARIMQALDCRVISGNHLMLVADRSRLVRLLRESGLKLAYENHPESSVEEILQKIGEGDEDVIGVAIDTGWCGSQGMDTVDAIRRLKERLWHIHLKDVKAPRSEKTGYELIDKRHETCTLGEGIVPVKSALITALEQDFNGPVCIEHEPELYDPTDECRLSLERVREWLSVE